MQEQVDGFYTRRPQSAPSSANKHAESHPTKPVSPDFELKRRLGPAGKDRANLKTTEEMEVEEMKNRAHFKALPVNKQILHGAMGLPHVETRPATQFETFTLHTELRAGSADKRRPSEPRESSSVRKARFNPDILVAPDFVPTRNTKSATVALPFSFETERRAGSRKRVERSSELTGAEFHALPMPQYPAKPFGERPKSKPHTIEFAEFKLSAGVHHQAKKADESADARSFKALPMPSFDQPEQTKRPHEMKKFTQPAEFTFETEKRAKTAFSSVHSVSATLPCDTFKAAPMPNFKNSQIAIKKSARPPTKPEGILLMSDKRAVQRAQFENEKKRLHEAQMKEKAEKDKEIADKEEREAKLLRQTMIFKASGIVRGHPVEIHASTQPLTVPQAPQLATAVRAQKKRPDTDADSDVIIVEEKENMAATATVTEAMQMETKPGAEKAKEPTPVLQVSGIVQTISTLAVLAAATETTVSAK